jgi:hypothetical protein
MTGLKLTENCGNHFYFPPDSFPFLHCLDVSHEIKKSSREVRPPSRKILNCSREILGSSRELRNSLQSWLPLARTL